MKIKVWCSSIRSPQFRERLITAEAVDRDERPQEGDVVVARVLSDQGAYNHVEEASGREVRVYAGDVIVGVLGTRKSGTNLSAVIPSGPLNRGDRLELAAVGGLLGLVNCAPRYYGGKALPLEVVSFFDLQGEGVANLRDGQRLPIAADLLPQSPTQFVFVTGSSAETGKTTFVCEALRVVHQFSPGLRATAIKACGTGRLRDLFRYSDAGAHQVTDFVADGWPSTYNLRTGEYSATMERLLTWASQASELSFVEVGGDLLEAGAPIALDYAAALRAPVVFCVKDALGAIAGLRILAERNIAPIILATLHQNQLAMSERLGVSTVVDPLNRDEVTAALLPHIQPLSSNAHEGSRDERNSMMLSDQRSRSRAVTATPG